MIRRAMRLCLWILAGLLVALGVYVLAPLLKSSDHDNWIKIAAFSTAFLLPAVLYLLTLSRYLRDNAQGEGSPKSAGALVFSVVLYLPLMILMSPEGVSGRNPFLASLFSVLVFLTVLWLFCAYAYGWLRGESSSGASENIRLRTGLSQWLESTSRILRPPVVLVLGAVLLAGSVLIAKTEVFNLLNGHYMWITAEYGLGDKIPAAKFLLGYLGPIVYGGSLVLAACTVVIVLVSRFSSATLRASRIAAVLGLVAGFLAICSITDFYFSWLSFLFTSDLTVANWTLFILFLLHWLVPLLFAAAVLRARRHKEESVDEELRILVVFYIPLSLFDFAMTLFFAGDGNLAGLFSPAPAAFLGLQFLAWGYIELGKSKFADPRSAIAG